MCEACFKLAPFGRPMPAIAAGVLFAYYALVDHEVSGHADWRVWRPLPGQGWT
jgi:hypothetical protein